MDLASLRAQQIELASSVCREDRLDKDPPAFIGGADVGFEQGGEVTRAAMVLLKYPSLELVEYKVARIATTMPYIPGFLSFREYPALLAAWEQLSQKPDLLFVDGHGISHPRRLGVASHFGLLVDVPTIGVAKKRLCGKFEPLSTEPGALSPLMDKGEQLAWVWRSKARCNPLFIATGHRVSTDSALAWVQRCMKGYRLPEPTRWADAVASGRPRLFVGKKFSADSGKLPLISDSRFHHVTKPDSFASGAAGKLAARYLYGLLVRAHVPELRHVLQADGIRRRTDLPSHSGSDLGNPDGERCKGQFR